MLPLFHNTDQPEPVPPLPPMSLRDEVAGDYRTAGLSLRGHPLQFVREKLDRMGIVPAQQLATLPVDRRYKVAGLVLLRQRPGTAKGITFVTIEDETGPANLIIRQEVWERYRRIAGGATAKRWGSMRRSANARSTSVHKRFTSSMFSISTPPPML